MQMDYWDSLTNRIHDSFSNRSTMRVWEILLMFDQVTPSSSSVYGLKVFSILTVVPRRGLQQCYSNISVFILV